MSFNSAITHAQRTDKIKKTLARSQTKSKGLQTNQKQTKGLQLHMDQSKRLHFTLNLTQVNREACISSTTIEAEKFFRLNTKLFLDFQTNHKTPPTAASKNYFFFADFTPSRMLKIKCSKEEWTPTFRLHHLKNQLHTSFTVWQS